MRRACVLAAIVLACGPLSRAAGAGRLPDWVREAAGLSTPAWATSSPAVVLHEGQVVEAAGAGRMVVTRRRVVRVLSPAGAPAAVCAAGFVRGWSEIGELHAWQVDENGKVREWSRADAVEASLTPSYELYSDARTLLLAPGLAPPGSVFAWETRESAASLLAEWRWWFGGTYPTLRSRFEIALPAGVAPQSIVFGAQVATVDSGGGRWSWTMVDQRALPREPMASDRWSARPAVAVRVPSVPDRQFGASLADWASVSAWLHALASKQDAATPEILARSAQLTAGETDTLAMIRALAVAAQRLNYVSVQLGLGRGWGYRPNPAGDVLRKGYGDCKDKANLLRSLLGVAGIRAWLLVVSADGPDAIEPRFPSPTQFDHCILAVQVPAGTLLPAAFDAAGSRRLVAFDPTDPLTPFGRLPANEQGALGLLVAPERGELLRLPVPAGGEDGMSRSIDARLEVDGALRGHMRERSRGSHATSHRRQRRALSESQFGAELANRLSPTSLPAELERFTAIEDSMAGGFELEADFHSPQFARVVQGRFLAIQPEFVGSQGAPPFPDVPRKQPIALLHESIDVDVTIELPAGFRADEIPQHMEQRFDFGSLSADWSVAGGVLKYVRHWRSLATTLEPERYPEVRALFDADREARRATVVLVK